MSVVRLTDRWISACRPPRDGRLSVADGLCKGLHLRVTTQGTKTFSVMLHEGGRLRRRTLGQYPAWSLADARRETLRLQREAAEAGPAAAAPATDATSAPPTPTALTFKRLVASYTELHLVPNTRSKEGGRKIFDQAAMLPFADRPAASLTKAEVVAVLDALVAANKPHGAANLLKSLHALYAWAVSRDAVPLNPCTGVRAPVRGNQRERVLTDAEIVAIIDACDEVPPSFGALVRVLLLTGARRCEVSEMRWRELDGSVWTLPAARSKNGRSNVLPLPPAVMRIISGMPRYSVDNDYVFTTTYGKRPSSAFSKRKLLLDAASRTTGWRLHDLRRTWRTTASKVGVPREAARLVLGHSVDTLDARYDQHDHREAKGAALIRVAAHFESLIGSRATLLS